MVGPDDLAKAFQSYDAILELLALVRAEDNPDFVAFAPRAAPAAMEFYAMRPCDQQPVNHGNGVIIVFATQSWAIVNQLNWNAKWR